MTYWVQDQHELTTPTLWSPLKPKEEFNKGSDDLEEKKSNESFSFSWCLRRFGSSLAFGARNYVKSLILYQSKKEILLIMLLENHHRETFFRVVICKENATSDGVRHCESHHDLKVDKIFYQVSVIFVVVKLRIQNFNRRGSRQLFVIHFLLALLKLASLHQGSIGTASMCTIYYSIWCLLSFQFNRLMRRRDGPFYDPLCWAEEVGYQIKPMFKTQVKLEMFTCVIVNQIFVIQANSHPIVFMSPCEMEVIEDHISFGVLCVEINTFESYGTL